jgi:hypothetical protein
MKKIISNLKNFWNYHFGTIEYVVEIMCVDGSGERRVFYNVNQLDGFVSDVNDDNYWNVVKIEKHRKYGFVYKKEIKHSGLWFQADNVTEMEYVVNHDYSFPIKHESLKNIKRV